MTTPTKPDAAAKLGRASFSTGDWVMVGLAVLLIVPAAMALLLMPAEPTLSYMAFLLMASVAGGIAALGGLCLVKLI